jgi:predicted ATPase
LRPCGKPCQATDAPILLVEGQTIALRPTAVEVDVVAFEQRVAQGRPDALEQASALYVGDLLSGFSLNEPAFEEWLMAERERLRELALEALAKLLAHQQRAPGSAETAVRTALQLIALDPLQEPVHRTLMRLYIHLGRRAAALRQYQLCVSVLQRELGVEPEAETRQLYQEILRRRLSREPASTAMHHREPPPPLPAPQVIGGSSTPFIGRDAELTRLLDVLAQARAGAGRLVAIVGEAGVGKTRLIAELASDTGSRDVQFLLGRCYESDQILSFGPWIDALRTSGIAGDDSLLHELAPVWRTELARLLPEVAVPGLPVPTDNLLQLFESVTRLLERLAMRRSLVLALEDLHWADDVTLRLLLFFARRLHARRILVIVTARDDEETGALATARTLQALSTEPCAERLALLPLSRADTQRLTQALVRPGIAHDAARRLEEQVWATSEGNPFVVVETTRALQQGSSVAEARTLLPERVRDLYRRPAGAPQQSCT